MCAQGHGPPPDLETRALPCDTLKTGTVLYRSHKTDRSALYFSQGNSANRYDDPQKRFGVCYASLSPEGAFAETFLRQRNGGLVDESELQRRSVTELTLTEPLRLVAFYGAGLVRLKATAAVSAGDVSAAQSWSSACFDHPDKPHGICYRVRHDNDQFGVALFSRCHGYLSCAHSIAWHKSQILGEIIARYQLCLI